MRKAHGQKNADRGYPLRIWNQCMGGAQVSSLRVSGWLLFQSSVNANILPRSDCDGALPRCISSLLNQNGVRPWLKFELRRGASNIFAINSYVCAIRSGLNHDVCEHGGWC